MGFYKIIFINLAKLCTNKITRQNIILKFPILKIYTKYCTSHVLCKYTCFLLEVCLDSICCIDIAEKEVKHVNIMVSAIASLRDLLAKSSMENTESVFKIKKVSEILNEHCLNLCNKDFHRIDTRAHTKILRLLLDIKIQLLVDESCLEKPINNVVDHDEVYDSLLHISENRDMRRSVSFEKALLKIDDIIKIQSRYANSAMTSALSHSLSRLVTYHRQMADQATT